MIVTFVTRGTGFGERDALPVRPRAPTAEEADRLAAACEAPIEKLVFWTLLDTGLRVSELCTLTLKDILRLRGRRFNPTYLPSSPLGSGLS